MPSPLASGRLISLDVFRGATIAAMILVNNAGDWGKTYAPLLHAPWHGWTVTDLVFPFFLFVVGVAIPFALPSHDAAPEQRVGITRKIWRRGVILFALGLFLNWFPFYTVVWERARIPGVLQRIAVVYVVCAFAWTHLRRIPRVALAAGLLAGYWVAMTLIPVPGFQRGELGAEGNVAAWVDQSVLGAHVWRYAPGPADPEGILSTVPAIVTGLTGLFAGEFFRRRRVSGSARSSDAMSTGGWLTLGGGLSAAAGLALDPWFPINKNLWSPPYVLLTSGLALLCLAPLHVSLDSRRRDDDDGRPRLPLWARPFAVFGGNSILAFVGSSLLARIFSVIRIPTGVTGPEGTPLTVSLQTWTYRRAFEPWFPEYVASLAWAASFVLLWFAVLVVLDRRKIYLRV